MTDELDLLLNKLYRRRNQGTKKSDLENMHRLSILLGHPEEHFPTVHVAGTNGKGSVATKIARGLQLTGAKVGLFTSPHLYEYAERISIDGVNISDTDLCRLLSFLFELCDSKGIPATFFEITTMLALKYFHEQAVGWAVIETGIGGRIDPTNIIAPQLSVITSVSLDHCDLLGNTVELIAEEKGGIIKPLTPIVIGPSVPRATIRSICLAKNAPCVEVTGNFPLYDDENNAVATACMNILNIEDRLIEKALRHRPACRMEIYSDKGPPAVIFDVAHNPEGLSKLFLAVAQLYPHKQMRVLCAMSDDKDISTCMTILAKHASAIHFTKADSPRACAPEYLLQTLQQSTPQSIPVEVNSDVESSMAHALQLATMNNEILIVCGTFFIMSQVHFRS